MAIDLTGARAAVEVALFGVGADQCRVIRRPRDPTTFQTGEYDVPAPGIVYEGDCSIRAQITALGGRGEQGAVPATQQRWTISMPLVATAADPPRPGDVVIMTTARDAALSGGRFVVRDVSGGTNTVLRRVSCDRWVLGGGDDWARPNT
jgi:hypothetical protein